jgi:UPF0271 protein
VIEGARTVVERALLMATEGQVVSIEGELIELRADTLCVHGDTPGAVEMVKEIRLALEAADMAVVPMMSAVSYRKCP